MEVGLVRSIDIDQTMQQAYLDYAMSVIVARALPDARDGLKPVHRRILYAMFDMGLRPDTAYKKSARIVGEVLGKYHPHGDMAVYESMARMAQDFSMRCLLVEGQGNFGSVDGDPPAAMRYTEARLTASAMEMLADIRKETVDFSDNFDGSLQEPDVLPSALPNLLVNGATGIAVGMSTNIPPHNLAEVVGALVYMLGNWERLDDVNIEDLMKFIQGPDFPTGGVIVQDTHEDDLTAAYGTGRGRVTVQSRCHIEEITRGRSRIIVTELPYMTNKSSLIEHIAQLARDGNLEGIADLRDESDRHGLRIVIELTRTAEPEKVLQDLYKRTAMRSTFGIIMLALVEGEPRMLSLKQALRHYLDHRLVVIRRRTEYELARARARLHILEGLRVALKHLDEIIDLIKKAPDADVARDRLMKRYRLSDIQAQAILDMQLRRLAALERKKIEDEYKELLAQIKDLETLLKSPLKMRQVVASELQQVKEAYGDRRRTQITRLGASAKSVLPVLTATDLLPEQTVWVSATIDGLISRTLDDKPPRISGNLAPRFLLQVNTRDTLFLVSEKGEAAGIPVQTLPEAPNPQDGSPKHKVSALSDSDNLAAVFTLPPKDERLEGWFVFTATQQGMLKQTPLEELPGPTGHSFTLVKVNDEDRLGWVRLTDGQSEILLATADGMAIRFHENDVRPMGLVAAGVNGIKLGVRDLVIGMELFPRRGEVLLITSDGKAKRVEIGQFPLQGRYGQGVIAWKLPRTSQLVGVALGRPTTRITVLIDKLAPKAMRLDEAPLQTRSASGKAVLDLKAGYQVLGLSIPWAVPRPVAGEKAVGDKEIQVPEEIEGQDQPEVEQLSFGMAGPAVKTALAAAAVKKGRSITAKTSDGKPSPAKIKQAKAAPVPKPKPEPVKAKANLSSQSKPPQVKPPAQAKAPPKPRGIKTTPTVATGKKAKPVKKSLLKEEGIPETKTSPSKVKTGSQSQAKVKVAVGDTKTKATTKTKSVKKEATVKTKSTPPAAAGKKPQKSTAQKSKPIKKTGGNATKASKPRKSSFTVKSTDVVIPNIVLPPGWKPLTKKNPQSKRKPKP
ncbi:MAG: DNA gyrase subunit A [Anaerolineae bacterium]|nr:DNA gyrase subunit A [Anaerolineae bacterium]